MKNIASRIHKVLTKTYLGHKLICGNYITYKNSTQS